MQGEQPERARELVPERDIPARAGRTTTTSTSTTTTTGHPCACRENGTGVHVGVWESGPSLRVQGEQRNKLEDAPINRAIPARAGRTTKQLPFVPSETGHPCACRENRESARLGDNRSGPSLRVQGELHSQPPAIQGGRAIPARAGRTRHNWLHSSRYSGHPCACRENGIGLFQNVKPSGPSLRVQGERLVCLLQKRTPRAIPARAGRTPTSRAIF